MQADSVAASISVQVVDGTSPAFDPVTKIMFESTPLPVLTVPSPILTLPFQLAAAVLFIKSPHPSATQPGSCSRKSALIIAA
jgi:hypothetical protein